MPLRDVGTPSPSASSIALPGSQHSRRTSQASQASQRARLPGTRLQALETIHTSASRSDTLTTFDDFSVSPRPASSGETKSIAGDLVQNGLSGLYSRLKATVGGSAPGSRQVSQGRQDEGDNLSVRSAGSRPVTSGKPSVETSSDAVSLQSMDQTKSSSIKATVSPRLTARTDRNAQTAGLLSPGGQMVRSKELRATNLGSECPADGRQKEDMSSPLPRDNSESTGSPSLQALRSPPSHNSHKLLEELAPKSPDKALPSRPDHEGLSDDSPAILDTPFAINTEESITPISESDATPLGHPASTNAKNASAANPNADRPAPANQSRGPLNANMALQRPPLIKVSQSHLPGFRPSRPASSDGTITPALAVPPLHLSSERDARKVMLTGRRQHHGASRMKSKILAKELWMRDETAKECFNCGDAFSAFRRKHHCRTCGNIFDAKCTVLVPGTIFEQPGRVRICRPCEAIVYGTDEDSSVYSEDGDGQSSRSQSLSPNEREQLSKHDPSGDGFGGSLSVGTPTMGVLMSRKQGSEAKRRSAVIEFDNWNHSIPRPSSSRSLKSLSGRPRSSSHKRHGSKHGHLHMKSLRSIENLAPFQGMEGQAGAQVALPAFHHDNVVDPDMAPFMSDEGSEEEDPSDLFAMLHADAESTGKQSTEKHGFAGLLASIRRGKQNAPERNAGTSSVQSRDHDATSLSSRRQPRHQRKRTLSISSVSHQHPSPRRSKSSNLLKDLQILEHADPDSSPMIPSAKTYAEMIRSSALRGLAAPAIELNQASLHHVRRLLNQMLDDGHVSRHRKWEKALIPILLKCTDDVNPDIQRNDDIDIRHYIKLKKIPGGKPGDTAYISGIVFTKNLALKSMPRSIPFPRIVLVTFAIEYARHQQHFMSLDPVISQEREYLRNLVKRIVALNPSVVLAEKHVAGLALDLLAEANIAVVYNVKASVLSAVSRLTQTKLITSVDKLSLDPSHVGRCGSFDVKTYVHGSHRKTYIYLTGCQKDLGCTIILRGAETEELRQLKRITEFMSYVVYNLKLETCVMRDEYAHIPAVVDGAEDEECLPNEEKHPQTSVAQEQISNNEVSRDDIVQSEMTALTGQAESCKNPKSTAYQRQDRPSFANDIVERHLKRVVSSSPFVKYMQPYLLTKVREQEIKMADVKALRDRYKPIKNEQDLKDDGKFELVQPAMVQNVVENPSLLVRHILYAVHSAEYERTARNYQVLKRQWEASCNNTRLFDPFNHQRIAVLYSMVNTRTSYPCIGPDVIALNFYAEHDLDEDYLPDITLGQYVEDLCHGASTACSSAGCGEPMYHHHRQYVHADAQMSVVISKYPARLRGMHNTILMWSSCRICGSETPIIPMSQNTWRYSFGKYLELTFWSAGLHARAHACPHDLHRDHVRYFGFNNVAIRVQYDQVTLHDVIVPKAMLTWKVENDLELKNDQYMKFKIRLDKFMLSVKQRLESIRIESVVPEKLEECRLELEHLSKRASEDHKALTRKLQEKYIKSRYYEIIPLNRAGRAIHECSLVWDELFADFEHNFFPSEKDIRRLATIQLKKLFLEKDESTSSMPSVQEGDEATTELKNLQAPVNVSPEISRKLSTMSTAEAKQALDSVVQSEAENEKHAAQEEILSGSAVAEEMTDVLRSAPGTTNLRASTLVDRDDVKHLDLAIPVESVLAEDQTVQLEGHVEELEKNPSTEAREVERERDLELQPQVSASVDRMREVADFEGTDLGQPPQDPVISESRIPRPVDSTRREGKPNPPNLLRTQSQPNDISSPSKFERRTDSMASGISANTTLSKTERLKSLIVDPARALERRMADRLTVGPFKGGRSISQSLIPRSVPSRQYSSRVSTLAKHFEQISREFEKQRARERQLRQQTGRRAYPLAFSQPVVEVYHNELDAVQEREPAESTIISSTPKEVGTFSSDQTAAHEFGEEAEAAPKGELENASQTETDTETDHDTNTTAERPSFEDELRSEADSVSGDDSETDQTFVDDVEVPESGVQTRPLSPSGSQADSSGELPKHEKTSIMKLLTSFWSERSASGWVPLEYPFAAQEHVWQDSDIIVREDEPASIIALALSSADYQRKLRQFRGQDSDSTLTAEDDMASIERNLLHPKNTNIRYAFQNRGVKAQCKIFFAESFDALRRKTGVADRFVESLSRCLKWDSKGGKTKSLFLKTLDDRFVLKSLSPVEVNAFFKLAPDYFFFIHQNLFTQLPSVIAKMFGLFQVTIRNPQSGIEFNWYMIVMENLFYDRVTNRRFDLKGSMRNRKIQSTGEQDEVLLDENFVDIIFEKPIFVREHTLKNLKNSVYNDTLFLSKQNVMDYSLMAGFSDSTSEILVGIIDCIRTYTWDKKLETWIKDRGKNKPTVTSPKDYRNRFRIAMSKYILQAPDCWHQFQINAVNVAQTAQVKVDRVDVEAAYAGERR